MPSSYNAPYSFALNPSSQGTGWTNLSEYLSQANMDAVRGMNKPVVFQPGVEPYDTQQAADFDNWLFSTTRQREPWDPTNVSNFPPETPPTTPKDDVGDDDTRRKKPRSDDDYRDRFPPEPWQFY